MTGDQCGVGQRKEARLDREKTYATIQPCALASWQDTMEMTAEPPASCPAGWEVDPERLEDHLTATEQITRPRPIPEGTCTSFFLLPLLLFLLLALGCIWEWGEAVVMVVAQGSRGLSALPKDLSLVLRIHNCP